MTGWWRGARGSARRRLSRGGVLLALLLAVGPAWAQQPLPDVDIMLAVEVFDAPAWLSLHDEVLGTPKEAPKPLGLSLMAGSGGRRWITVNQPKFATDIILTDGVRTLKVVVSGKISGAEALSTLSPFALAVTQAQAGSVQNQLTMVYGLSGVNGRLLEVQISRP